MRHFRDASAILQCLVEEHEKQGFVVYPTERGLVIPIPRDVGMAENEIMDINLTIIANAIWESLR